MVKINQEGLKAARQELNSAIDTLQFVGTTERIITAYLEATAPSGQAPLEGVKEAQGHEWFMGEAVGFGAIGTRMEWVDTDEAIDRLHCGSFLGLWVTPGDDDSFRLAFCTMDGDGDIWALGDSSTEEEEANPSWRRAAPDRILVPVDGYNAALLPASAEPVAWESCGPKGIWAADDDAFDPKYRRKSEALGFRFRALGVISPPASGAVEAGLSEWEGWDRSRGDWSESKHKDAVLWALFDGAWSIEDAVALIGFIDRTWTKRPAAPTEGR